MGDGETQQTAQTHELFETAKALGKMLDSTEPVTVPELQCDSTEEQVATMFTGSN